MLLFFCSIAAVTQSSLGFLLSRRWALSLCSRSSREGFSFLLPEQKKRNKENSPSALFGLLRQVFPLNKKNSLRSNSFLFLTLHTLTSASRPKSEAGPNCFFATSLRSLGRDVFLSALLVVSFCHPAHTSIIKESKEVFDERSE